MHTSRQYASKVNPYPPAVAQTTYPMRNGVLGKRTADDIVQMKIEDIIGKKLGDYEHPNKMQKTFNGRVPSSKNVPQTHPTIQATGSRILYMGNLRYKIKESDIINFFKDAGEVIKIRLGTKNGQFAGYAHVDFATSDAAQKAIKLNGELLLNRPVKLDFAPERGSNTPSDMALAIEKKQEQNKTAAVTANGDVEAKHNDPKSNDSGILDKLQPPETPQAVANTLFVTNLSFSVTKIDIVNFFKDAGEIVDIRLAMKNDWFIGFGLVEFATRDAALKALKLNGESLLNRPVKLEFARNRGADTPSNSNWRFSQNSLQSQGLTVLVEGFGTFSGVDDPYDSIRCVLEEHFGQCGEITRMYIPKDYENDCPQGVAYIDFINHEAFSKALELSGSEVSGGTITVKDANQSDGDFVKGKTDAEDTIEKKIVDSKKQNLVKDDVAPAAEKKKA